MSLLAKGLTELWGTAVAATKLATARTINGVQFDGTANITLTAANVGAIATTGGTATGNITAPDFIQSSTQSTNAAACTRKDYVDSAIAAGDALQVSKAGDTMTGGLTFVNAASELGWVFNTDYAKIGFKNTADGDTDSYMWFKTGDNGNEYFKWQGVSGANTSDWMSLKSTGLVVAAGVTAPTFTGDLAGNAATATKLATARQINGTNFDGSGNITTANWGTARTLTIGNSGKSVNGDGNVSWSLSEIGAAQAMPLNLGSAGGKPRSSRLLSIGKTDNSCSFIISSQGDFGNRTRGWYQVSVATRGNIITVDAYSINAKDSADPLKLFTVDTGSLFEVWGEFSDYNNDSSVLICSSHGAIFLGDQMTSAKDWTGFSQIAINKIYTSTDKPTSADVGLGSVNNWGATSAVNDTSDTTYATAGAVKKAYDLAATKLEATANAVSASKLATAQTINGTNFDGTANITTANWGTARTLTIGDAAKSVNGAGDVSWSLDEIGAVPQARTINTKPLTSDIVLSAADVGALPSGGTAVAATKLVTARTIGGVAFDGTANINLPGVDIAGNQSTTGNAATATKLATARTISGVSFDGTANITLTAADVGAIATTGGTATGNITAPDFIQSSTQSTNAAACTRKDYVDSAIAAGDALQVSKTGDTMTGALRTPYVYLLQGRAEKARFGTGGADIFIQNVVANKYLQLKDDGTLQYSDQKVYHQGFKPTANDVGALPATGGTVSGAITATNFMPTATVGGGLGLAAGNGDGASLTTNNIRIETWFGFGIWCTQGTPQYSHSFDARTGGLYARGNGDFNDVYIRSDSRMKSGLVKVDNALARVSKITAYSYNKHKSISDHEIVGREVGIVAQELQAVLPEAVNTAEDTTLTISNSAVTALLVEAIKELKDEIDQLRRLINGT